MATAPRINNFSGYTTTGNIESRRHRGEPNIRNEIWRDKWHPNMTLNQMRNLQSRKRNNSEAYGAQLFIHLQSGVRKELINLLENNPVILRFNIALLLPHKTRSERANILQYLFNNKEAILADPRLQGGKRRRRTYRRK